MNSQDDTSTAVAEPKAGTRDASTWAHTIATPESGCLLIARRPDMGFFTNSVILLLQHSELDSLVAPIFMLISSSTGPFMLCWWLSVLAGCSITIKQYYKWCMQAPQKAASASCWGER